MDIVLFAKTQGGSGELDTKKHGIGSVHRDVTSQAEKTIICPMFLSAS